MKIGVLGAGQLGRMLALAGTPLEHQFYFYDPSGTPSAGLANITIDKGGNNQELINHFLSKIDVVTYEFENIPHKLTQQISLKKPLFPSSESIRICQNRTYEKELFTRLGIPTAQFKTVSSKSELEAFSRQMGTALMAKSVTEGYDGKGQYLLQSPDDAAHAWAAIKHKKVLAETFINFKRELSIIAVRAQSGEVKFYPLTENKHHKGILRYSFAPAPQIKKETQKEAESYIRALLEEMKHVGVLTLELFETQTGLVANEMAPRVHNSGHWTIEGSACSQFENHIRAIAGQPLGDTSTDKFNCMINIIGKKGNTNELLALPYVHMHMYDKRERKGRKLGHLTIQADSYQELIWRVENTISMLPGSPETGFSITSKSLVNTA